MAVCESISEELACVEVQPSVSVQPVSPAQTKQKQTVWGGCEHALPGQILPTDAGRAAFSSTMFPCFDTAHVLMCWVFLAAR